LLRLLFFEILVRVEITGGWGWDDPMSWSIAGDGTGGIIFKLSRDLGSENWWV
jgi:hypothetical protein